MIYDINSWSYQKYMKWNIGFNKPANYNESITYSGSYWAGNND